MGFLPDETARRLREEVERRGLILLDLKRRGERGSTVIEIVIDAESADVNLDELAEINRFASDLFDEIEENLPSRYRLEVSTPGLGRPLEHAWQYRKNIGRLVKVSYRDESETVRSDLFRLAEVAGTTLILAPKVRKKGTEEASVSVEIDRIVKAVVEPEF